MKQHKMYRRAVLFLFIVLMVGLPFSKALCSLSLTGLVLLGLLNVNHLKISLKQDSAILVLGGLFVLLIPGLFSSYDIKEAFSLLYKNVLFLGVVFSLIAHKDLLTSHSHKAISYFISSCAIASVITLLFFILPEVVAINLSETIPLLNQYEQTINRVSFGLYSPFIDRLQFSYLIGIALILSSWIYFSDLHKGKFFWYFTMVNVVAFILLGGRGAQLGLLLILPIWTYFFLINKNPNLIVSSLGRLKLLLVSLSLIIVIPTLLYTAIPAVQKRYDQLFWELKLVKSGEYKQWDYEYFTSLRRLLSLKHHGTLISANPWLGVGLGDYRQELQQAYDKEESMGLHLPANAHNQYLYFWANAGIFSLLLFLFVIYFWFKECYLYTSLGYDRAVLISFTAFFLFIWLFDIFISYQIGAISFTLFAGLLFYRLREANTTSA